MQRPSFSHALDRLESACLAGAGLTLVSIALLQAWQVFGRYVLNASPGWTEPVALILMGLTVMLGAAVAVRHESHFRFGMIAEGGTPARRAALTLMARVIAAACGLLMAVYGTQLMLDDWAVPMAGAGLPSGLRFLGLALGGLLIPIFAVERIVGGGPKPVEAE